jgi:aconitate hydratase
LTFKDEDDYDKFEEGQEWTLRDIRQHLENGDKGVTAEMDDGTQVTLLAEYSDREREILLQGGVRRQLREQKPAEAPASKVEPASTGGDEDTNE